MNLSAFADHSIPSVIAWARKSLPILCLAALLLPLQSLVAQTNAIVLENMLAGTPQSQWDITGAGDLGIQGFATQISVNKDEEIHFKIKTSASAYRVDIYRLGYYQGLGARLVASILPSATLPQNQPVPLTDAATGLIDCGNWTKSASWHVPADATSGIYLANLVRSDTGGASHVVFIVRDDAGSSDLLFKTSDATWQAYNDYGGNSLYARVAGIRAFKVSYNRPFNTRGLNPNCWVFNAEYPMVRWLEANGYDVSYATSVDTQLRGSLLVRHKLFLSVGHDEYWSGGERTNVEAAVSAGVNLAFLSGNELFWKTRWEPSIDDSATPCRTLVCYKETHANAKIDPSSLWTGTWRDPRFSPPADGGRPENKLTGTLFMINAPATSSIQVPATYGAHRFWRNTSVATLAPGANAVFPFGTLGFEWDTSPDNGFRPPGLMQLSSTTVNGVPVLQNYGSTYDYGQATHHLCLYRHASGALVFGAGTVQWSWGLDSHHDFGNLPPSPPMEQATVNLLADMGIQPGTLKAELTPATRSADFVAPSSTILTPAPGATVQLGNRLLITGTASDIGGLVWGVEVSTDGGTNWRPAIGLNNWSFTWTPNHAGPATILSRAVDDSGNLEIPPPGVTVTVPLTQVSIWPISVVPGTVQSGLFGPIELGLKFRSDVGGNIVGIRFYKTSLDTGSHVANLWTRAGTLLASAAFTGESLWGWQQVNFASPVSIAANTVYVASYHCSGGRFSADTNYFAVAGVNNPPLHALANGVSGPNGVFASAASSTFPNAAFNADNYWVDVAFQPGPLPASITITPANPTLSSPTQAFTATAAYAGGGTQDVTSQAIWTSSRPSVATIDTNGMATAFSVGSTIISATLAGVTGSTSLLVVGGCLHCAPAPPPLDLLHWSANPAGLTLWASNNPAFYFLVERSTNLTDFSPWSMKLGQGGPVWVIPYDSGPSAAFFRIQRISLYAPGDVDHDGIDDVWELDHGLNPLNPQDAGGIDRATGITWQREYQQASGRYVSNNESISPEISIYNFGVDPGPPHEAVSPEVSIYAGERSPSATQHEAVSHLISLYNLGADQPRTHYEAVSIEISLRNVGSDPGRHYEAISPEVTVYAGERSPPAPQTEAFSREVSIYLND